MSKGERLTKSIHCLYYLSGLNQKELKQFELYLNSPFLNSTKGLIHFFQQLNYHILPKKEPEWPLKEELFQIVYPEKKYKSGGLNKDFHTLQAHLFRFWELLEFQEQREGSKQLLLKALVKRKLDHRLPRIIEKEIQKQKNQKAGVQPIEEIYQLEMLLFILNSGQSPRQKQVGFKSLFRIAEESVFLRILRMSLADLDRHRSLQIEVPLEQIVTLISSWREVMKDKPAHLKSYLRVFDFINKQDEVTSLEALLKDLKTSPLPYDAEIEGELLSLALNECIRRTNSGDKRFDKRAIEVYSMLLKSDLPSINRSVPILHVKNILQLYCSNGDYAHAEQFLKTYENHLNEGQQERVKNYGQGLIAFFKGCFEDAIELLDEPGTKNTDIFIKIDAKLLSLKSMYECYSIDQEDLFQKKMGELKGSLSREKKLQANRYEGHRQFQSCLNLLWKIKWGNPDQKASDLEKLKEKVIAMKKIANTHWLEQKILEIK